MTITQTQITLHVDERLKQTANVAQKYIVINKIVSWKGRVRTRTGKATSNYDDLNTDDIDDDEDNNQDLKDDEFLHINNSISFQNVLERDNIVDVRAPNSYTDTPLLTDSIVVPTMQRGAAVNTLNDAKGDKSSNRSASTGSAAGTLEAITLKKVPKCHRRKRRSTTTATQIPTSTMTPRSVPPSAKSDPMQVVIDIKPPMSTATASKEAIISVPSTDAVIKTS